VAPDSREGSVRRYLEFQIPLERVVLGGLWLPPGGL